jgi:hypothetical protein
MNLKLWKRQNLNTFIALTLLLGSCSSDFVEFISKGSFLSSSILLMKNKQQLGLVGAYDQSEKTLGFSKMLQL